jgi:hypothetical protein
LTTNQMSVSRWVTLINTCSIKWISHQNQRVLCWLLGLMFHSEDGASTFFWNVSELLPDCTALHPRI